MDNKELVKVGEEVVKQKRPNRSARLQKEFHEFEPGDGVKTLGKAMMLWDLPAIDNNDVIQVENRTRDYFNICAENDMKPSVAGYAFALGVDRRTLWTWVTGVTPKPPAVLDCIKKAYEMLNIMMEEYMQTGKINPVSGIFLMKNNFGYTDKQEVVVTPNNPLGETTDQKALEERYLESVVIDDET